MELRRDRREAIRVPLAFACPIVLVIILGRPPFALGFYRCDDAAVMGDIGARNCFASLALLFLALREDRRAILGSDIIALAVELGRVVNRKEDVE